MVGPARVGRHFPRGGPKILNVLFGFQRPQRQARMSSLDIVLLSTMTISPSDLGHVVRDARAASLRLNQKDDLILGSFDCEVDATALARPCHQSYFEQPAPFV
jgi:hypothetical protein